MSGIINRHSFGSTDVLWSVSMIIGAVSGGLGQGEGEVTLAYQMVNRLRPRMLLLACRGHIGHVVITGHTPAHLVFIILVAARVKFWHCQSPYSTL
jgi:hypothetical protein